MKKIFVVLGRHSMSIMFFHIISFSIVTLSVHYLLGMPFPEHWTKVYYREGIYGIISALVGVIIPLLGGILYDEIKKKIKKEWKPEEKIRRY